MKSKKIIAITLSALLLFSAGIGSTFLGQYIISSLSNESLNTVGNNIGGNTGNNTGTVFPYKASSNVNWGTIPEGKSLSVKDIPKYNGNMPVLNASELPKFKSIDELASILKTTNTHLFDAYGTSSADKGSAVPAAEPGRAQNEGVLTDSAASSGSPDFVGTNVQVEGIDEGDILKTDGKYLYIAAQNIIYIIKADDPHNITKVSSIKLPENTFASQIFISGDKLVIMSSFAVYYDIMPMPAARTAVDAVAPDSVSKDMAIYPANNKQYVSVYIYNVADKASPSLIREVAVEGYLNNSRLKDGKVYIVATKWIYSVAAKEDGSADLNQLLPTYRDTAVSDNVQVVAADKISYFPDKIDSSYLTIASIDLTSDNPVHLETLLGSAEQMYMSHNNLYITRTAWQENTNTANIYKFALTDEGVQYSGFGTVKGFVKNQFSIDEYNGNLRIATTDWSANTTTNNLFVLDSSMKVIGSITDLARGETIYSVRFMGNTGYVVTFRQIDPLFVIDLSNPNAPVVRGELKIPGFSDYLHPLNENTLIGIGRDTQDMYVKDEFGNETVIGTRQAGIKLSLFDVSNPEKPVEITHKVIGGAGAYSEALYNHKAFYFDAKHNIMAMPIYYDNESKSKEQILSANAFDGALAFSISNTGFDIIGKMVPSGSYGVYTEKRLCSIGNTMFYLANGSVSAFDYTTFNQLAQITLQ